MYSRAGALNNTHAAVFIFNFAVREYEKCEVVSGTVKLSHALYHIENGKNLD